MKYLTYGLLVTSVLAFSGSANAAVSVKVDKVTANILSTLTELTQVQTGPTYPANCDNQREAARGAWCIVVSLQQTQADAQKEFDAAEARIKSLQSSIDRARAELAARNRDITSTQAEIARLTRLRMSTTAQETKLSGLNTKKAELEALIALNNTQLTAAQTDKNNKLAHLNLTKKYFNESFPHGTYTLNAFKECLRLNTSLSERDRNSITGPSLATNCNR